MILSFIISIFLFSKKIFILFIRVILRYSLGPSGSAPGAMEDKIKVVANDLYDQMKASEISPVCAGLSLQIQLLETVLEGYVPRF